LVPVAGVAVSALFDIGTDYVFLKIEESQEREGYKEELISEIEYERAANLAAIQTLSISNSVE
jgi:hypothetical protein